MTTTMSAAEVLRDWNRLLTDVSTKGNEVIVERAGRKIARIVPLPPALEIVSRTLRDIRKARGIGKNLWREVSIPEYIEKERTEWN